MLIVAFGRIGTVHQTGVQREYKGLSIQNLHFAVNLRTQATLDMKTDFGSVNRAILWCYRIEGHAIENHE